jgi:hypothetical protein
MQNVSLVSKQVRKNLTSGGDWNSGGASVSMRGFFSCIVAATSLAAALCATSVMAQTPQINSVQFSGSAGNYSLTLKGIGFGSPTVATPFRGDVTNFRIADSAQVGHAEWGYSGDANVLTYASWTDSAIAITGFGGEPCDSLTIAVWNAGSHNGGTWGGNAPCTVSPPQITSVDLSGTGANLQIVVHGTGFGPAPSNMPLPGTAGDLNYFWLIDFRSHCGASSSLFEAGFERWGGAPDSVTLRYESWADNQIVISGFGGTYGAGCANYQVGDPIAIVVYNTEDTSDTEPQTAWGGPAAAGIAISVNDLTSGKPVISGSTIPAGDEFQVTVMGAPAYNCAGQFVVTAVGAAGAPPSALVQIVPFIIGPFTGGNSATGGILSSNGTSGEENDWKISASCNGASTNSFAFSQFEFLSAVQ